MKHGRLYFETQACDMGVQISELRDIHVVKRMQDLCAAAHFQQLGTASLLRASASIMS